METAIVAPYKDTHAGQEADEILRACVHCGFCTATCPTYQLLGNELDGPRGRIYLIKQVLEGQQVTRLTQRHLDRCLTCTACETTCPSGVRYHHLLDIGREVVDAKVDRPVPVRLQRYALRKIVPYSRRFSALMRAAQTVRPLLPKRWRRRIPRVQSKSTAPESYPTHTRKILMLAGCAQSVLTPKTNEALVRILDRLSITAVQAGDTRCCGALNYHLGAKAEAIESMRRNIDAWWPAVEAGVEAIVSSASGCGAVIKDYGHILRHDDAYADKAAKVSALAKDPVEILAANNLQGLRVDGSQRKIAFHSPCTLQHTQKLGGAVETILRRTGFQLVAVAESHLCCGSAGTYSILQPELSQQLLENKLESLVAGDPELIATANVGCQLHLQSRARVPVKHWLELLDES